MEIFQNLDLKSECFWKIVYLSPILGIHLGLGFLCCRIPEILFSVLNCLGGGSGNKQKLKGTRKTFRVNRLLQSSKEGSSWK